MNSHQNPTLIFTILHELIPNSTWKCKVLRAAKILLRKNKAGKLTLLDVYIYYTVNLREKTDKFNYTKITFVPQKASLKKKKESHNTREFEMPM